MNPLHQSSSAGLGLGGYEVLKGGIVREPYCGRMKYWAYDRLGSTIYVYPFTAELI